MTTDPQRHGLLHRARRDGGVVILKVFPSKGHFFFGPEACDQSQCLVCELTRAFERAPSGRPIGGEGSAHAESRQQTTLSEEIHRSALLGQ